MTDEQLGAEVIGLRRQLAALQKRLHAGERSALYVEARGLADQVICLLDEAPERKHATLHRLADSCEAMLQALVH